MKEKIIKANIPTIVASTFLKNFIYLLFVYFNFDTKVQILSAFIKPYLYFWRINEMNGIYLLLGTNLGNKKRNMQQCLKLIAEKMGDVMRCSALYKTAAWGVEDQDCFLNQVVKITSDLSATQLLDKIHHIEKTLGRVRKHKWHERVIDIDILYYKDEIICEKQLTIPHPQLHRRRFTLVPLCEIAPDEIHPKLKKTNKILLEECSDALKVERLSSTISTSKFRI